MDGVLRWHVVIIHIPLFSLNIFLLLGFQNCYSPKYFANLVWYGLVWKIHVPNPTSNIALEHLPRLPRI